MSSRRAGRDARRAAGRLCLIDFSGPAPTAALERRIRDDHIAGVVLFRKNVRTPAQVASLTATLQSLARAAHGSPLWIAIDHEGGAVTRFPPEPPRAAEPPTTMGGPRSTPGGPRTKTAGRRATTDGQRPTAGGLRATPVPSAMALGASRDAGLARDAGRVIGRELRAMGIALNFAPVLDVNSNPANPIIGARAFGEDPALVDIMGSAYIGGLQEMGVAATAKHFPGHGDVSIDSHVGLPRVDHDLRRLSAVELVPFAGAVRAGVAAVMTAHIMHPVLDPSGAPATMSEPVLTGLLRDGLGFRGLICTDSMGMRAIVDHFGVGEAAVDAVKAGADVVLALGPEAQQEEMLEHLARAIEEGAIPARRIADAHRTIDAARAKWVRANGPADDLADAVGTPDHLDVARRIAAAAITRVRDYGQTLPLKGAIGVISLGDSSENGDPFYLATALQRHGAMARACVPDDLEGLDRVVAVMQSRGSPNNREAATVLDLYRRAADRLVVVAAGDPYDLLAFPHIQAYVATYGGDELTLEAAAQVLLGLAAPRGRLPVTLPGLHPAGTG